MRSLYLLLLIIPQAIKAQIKVDDSPAQPKTEEVKRQSKQTAKYDSSNIRPTNPEIYIGQTMMLYVYNSKNFTKRENPDFFIQNHFPTKNSQYKITGISAISGKFKDDVALDVEDISTGEKLVYNTTRDSSKEVMIVAHYEKLKRDLLKSGSIWMAKNKDGFWRVEDFLLRGDSFWVDLVNESGEKHTEKYNYVDVHPITSYQKVIDSLKIGDWVVTTKAEYGRFKDVVVSSGTPYIRFAKNNGQLISFDLSLKYPFSDEIPPLGNGYLPYFNKTAAEKFKSIHGRDVFVAVLNNEVKIGMNKQAVEYSLGKPIRVNETVTGYGASEQWVYENCYIYFKGSRVSATQNR